MLIKSKEPFIVYLEKTEKRDPSKCLEILSKKMRLNEEFKFWEIDEKSKDPIINLFYWSVLFNRFEIAKIFWRLGKVKIKFLLIILNLNI